MGRATQHAINTTFKMETVGLFQQTKKMKNCISKLWAVFGLGLRFCSQFRNLDKEINEFVFDMLHIFLNYLLF